MAQCVATSYIATYSNKVDCHTPRVATNHNYISLSQNVIIIHA